MVCGGVKDGECDNVCGVRGGGSVIMENASDGIIGMEK